MSQQRLLRQCQTHRAGAFTVAAALRKSRKADCQNKINLFASAALAVVAGGSWDG
jgi:hypothetical protein